MHNRVYQKLPSYTQKAILFGALIFIVLGFRPFLQNNAIARNIQSYIALADTNTAVVNQFSLTEAPQTNQLYPRDRGTNQAIVPIRGDILDTSINEVRVNIYREGISQNTLTQPLTFENGQASFDFAPTIPAELANYRFEILIVQNGNTTEIRSADNIVAGDAYLINGQSNAQAKSYVGSANFNQSPFIRSFGTASSDGAAVANNLDWVIADGDSRFSVGSIGQWGLRLGRLILDEHQVPVALFNGGHAGKKINFFQRDDWESTDLTTNYGRQLFRLQQAGIGEQVSAIIWFQGESDGTSSISQKTGFGSLHMDWQEDFPGAPIYVLQIRNGCISHGASLPLREVQRKFADTLPNVSVMSTTAVDAHDGCHYGYTDGYETIAAHIYGLINRDLYGATTTDNVKPPNPALTYFSRENGTEITIVMQDGDDSLIWEVGAESDFVLEGSSIAVTSGSVFGNQLVLQLSGDAQSASGISYGGHSGAGAWVTNGAGVGMLTFYDLPIAAYSPNPPNIPPWLADPGSQSTVQGQSGNLSFLYGDYDDDPLTFSATGLPPGLTIDSQTGLVSGVVTTPGAYSVDVMLTDAQNGSANITFPWTVYASSGGSIIEVFAVGSTDSESIQLRINDQIVKSWTVSTQVGVPYGYQHNQSVTADEVKVHFTNDGVDPATGNNRNLYVNKITIDGTSYESEGPDVEARGYWDGTSCQTPGFYETEFLACNGYFQYASLPTVNQPPTAISPGNQSNEIGAAISLPISASDPDGNTLTYSIQGQPPGLIIDSQTGAVSGILNSTGVFNVSVNVDDGNGGTDSIAFTWMVNSPPVGGCGGLIQEGESADYFGSFRVGTDSSASGGAYLYTPFGSGNAWNGPTTNRAEFCVNITTAGTYRLRGTVLAASGGRNSFYVRVDASPISGFLWDTTISSTYVDDYVAHRGGADPVEIQLGAGEHNLAIYLRESGTILDKIALELVNEEPPQTGCSDLPQEAEAGLLSGTFTTESDPNASGGQYIHVPNGTGNNFNGPDGIDKVEYCFTIDSAGTYLLETSVQAPSGGSNSFYVTVDGEPTNGHIWDTATSNTFVNDFVASRSIADPLELNLEPGDHTVVVYLREDGTKLDTIALINLNDVDSANLRSGLAVHGTGEIIGTLLVPSSVDREPAIAGLTVTLEDPTTLETISQTETSVVGKFFIDNVPASEYLIWVDVPTDSGETVRLEQTITVVEGERIDASFDLGPVLDPTETATPTVTATPLPSSTMTPMATSTATLEPTSTPEPTHTSTATSTATTAETATPDSSATDVVPLHTETPTPTAPSQEPDTLAPEDPDGGTGTDNQLYLPMLKR
ncbi:MAG: putative Ig domain-containing protein [Chloroflexota bacterium]